MHDIAIRVERPVDTAALAASLEHDLEQAGLSDPTVRVEIVPSLERQQTGKLKQFVSIKH